MSSAIHEPARAVRRPPARSGNVPIDRALLFAGHAECPCCRSFVRRLTQLGDRTVIGELVEGWCSVCCTSTFFLLAA